jgi:Trk-type K+ transport system membrane component
MQRSEYQTDRQSPSTFIWLINGLFQIVSTRTAGFSVTPLADIHPAVQVSFLVMMYISAFPTAIAMRETNVYEERSLGVYENENDSDSESEARNGKHIGLAVHIQRQLGFDLWYVILGLFLVAIAEGGRLHKVADDPAFSLFSVLFEIVSAYGTVGFPWDILRQKQACVPSLIGCQSWSLSRCSCVEDIVDSLTHWIMQFCCHVNRIKMTRMKGRAGWGLGSKGVPRI